MTASPGTCTESQECPEAVDVLVWGGGSGGATAAIQAARSGAGTLLLTPGRWLGGMVSAAGVCCPDGNELTPWQTGLWGALLRALETAEPEGLDHNWVSCFGYRPASAEAILQGWVAELPNLLWLTGCRLLGVERIGAVIRALELLHRGRRQRVACRVLIDGSDRGDLLLPGGVPHRLGWEPWEQWQEPSAPTLQRLQAEDFFKAQPVQSPTWVVTGQLQGDPPAAAATTALPAPFQGACAAYGLERTITYGRLPGGLVMLNWPLQGNDWHSGLAAAFRGDPLADEALGEAMQAHSVRFAQALQEASGGWLQLGHAFPQGSGSPAPWLAAMPYWREGRRMVGRHTLIEQELLPQASGASTAALPRDASGAVDAVAVGNYANDHHYPGPDWPLAPKSCRWGGRWSGTPFCVPYRALLSAEVDNLLAADKAFSTSHMANGATRLQPLILNIGQAAGAAAALAVSRGIPPGDLPARELQLALIHDDRAPAAPFPLWDTPWHHPRWRERQLALLADPALLQPDGRWGGPGSGSGSPLVAPVERLERCWQGVLHPDGDGSYALETPGPRRWPVITLEPAMEHWLTSQDRPTSVALIGCANPWGPWLRVSRLAG